MRRIGYRYQRTLKTAATVTGTGYLTGAEVRVTFNPAPPNTGVVFQRTDRPHARPIPALAGHVTGAHRRTTLGQAPDHVEMVEHVLAALAGLRIDNCLVEINAAETPGLDGSAAEFAAALLDAGTTLQRHPRPVWACERPLTVFDGKGGTLTLHPIKEETLYVSYILDYGPTAPIPAQRHTHEVTPTQFLNGLADCRTFLLLQEAEMLQRQGLGVKTTMKDLLVFGPQGPIGNSLRYGNEPARHKALDMVGDLALFGFDLRGHLIGCRSGHALNVALVRRLRDDIRQQQQSTTPRRAAA